MQSDQIIYLTIIVIAIGILSPGRAQNTAQTTSCQGRCLDPKLSTDKCHCHESCRFDGDCCNDFVEVCANQSTYIVVFIAENNKKYE
ncbi:vitronectin-like [Ciona intestinalis]